MRRHVPGLVPGRAEDQQATRRPGAAAQGTCERRRPVEPAGGSEQSPERRDLVGIHRSPWCLTDRRCGGFWQDQAMATESSGATAPDVEGLAIGVLGGTGDQGRGLARRLSMAGHRVVIGSRKAERAAAAAAELGGGLLSGVENRDAAAAADVVIAAVPWEGHRDLLASLADPLAGKVVIDCVNPMGFDSHGAYPLPVAEGSAAEQAAAVLPDSDVVGAFHHVPSGLLLDPGVDSVDMDVLVL